MSRYNKTVRFPDRINYERVCALSEILGMPIGRVIAILVDKDMEERGIRLGKRRGIAKQA